MRPQVHARAFRIRRQVKFLYGKSAFGFVEQGSAELLQLLHRVVDQAAVLGKFPIQKNGVQALVEGLVLLHFLDLRGDLAVKFGTVVTEVMDQGGERA